MFFSKTKRNYIAASTLVLRLVTKVFTGGLAQTKKKKRTIKYYTVAANQVMRVRLNDELDSEKARIGDTFTSTLVDPVYSKTGLMLAPQGCIVCSRVTSVQRGQKKGKPAELLVQVSSVGLAHGEPGGL